MIFHYVDKIGIPYLSCSAVKKIVDENEEREAKYENDKPTFSIPENYKKFMEETK